MPFHRSLTSAQQTQPPPLSGQGAATSGQVRVRQHVNPLARRWSQPLSLPRDWYTLTFSNPDLPLIVDIGVAKGRFLMRMAAKEKGVNFLGLEIRERLVHQANRIVSEMCLDNLFYLACNANVSLGTVLEDVPDGMLKEVYVQFCDPWFKKRHAKRRMVNEGLVEQIYKGLKRGGRGGRIFVQSDVLEVAKEMRYFFETHGSFRRAGEEDGFQCDSDGWLSENPLEERTERETAVLAKGGNVYRALYHLKEDEDRGVS